ncbi:ATP-binding protein [Enterobacteriaceae bacterium C23F]
MMNLQKESVLNRLSRHHYLLINGGGMVITLCVLLAFGLEVWALFRDYQTKIQQEIAAEVAQISDLRTKTTATLRNGIQNIELFLNAPMESQPGPLQAFKNNNGNLLVQASPEAQPVLVMSTQPEALLDDAGPALALATNVSPMAAKIRDRNSGELFSTYIYSSDGKYLLTSVAPWTAVIHNRLLAQQYKMNLVQQSLDIEDTLRSSNENARPDIPVLHWFPAGKSALTQKSVFRIAATLWQSSTQRFGTLVIELPSDRVERLLPTIGQDAECLILDQYGNLILPCSPHSAQRLMPLAREVEKEKTAQNRWVDYQGDRILRGWQLNNGDWSVVYAQSWKDILDDNRKALVVLFLSSCLIIFMTWFLLLTVKRRVLLPAVRQSEQVFESEQLSRTLIDTAPVGLGLLGMNNGKMHLRSPVMAQMQSRLQMRGFNLPAELIRRYQRLSLPPLVSVEKRLNDEDVTFDDQFGSPTSLSVSVTPVRYRGEDTLVVAFIDVTAKKQLAQQLLAAKEAADRASAAKSAFLATMSHEIRTPLNAILGNLELLEYSALDSQRDRLAVIRHASDNLLATISDVLDFSKIEAGELHIENISFDLVDIATRSLEIFAPVAQAKGIQLLGELGNTLTLPVMGDPTCMQQVLNNLLSNALKFTERGQVTLRLRADEAANELHIDVEDSGIGMTPAQQAQIFNPFSQADESINRRYGGTGLGLALCMRLVNTMGGEISVSSQPDQGSVFSLCFPLPALAHEAERPQFDGQTVFLVCANPHSRSYLAQALRSWGLDVNAFQHPIQLDVNAQPELTTLILWGDRSTWHPDDENRLVEEANRVIDCQAGGPPTPLKTGRLLSTSIYGLKGLALALGNVLQGTTLPGREQPQSHLTHELRVLVAEDNPVNARLFEEQLQLLGCHATLVPEGEEALIQLQNERFDILLTDLSMPGMDGYTLAKRVKAQWPDLPVMAVTANATEQEYQACEAAGMSRVLTKPLLLAELKEALFGLLGDDEHAPDPMHTEPLPLYIPPRPAPALGFLGGNSLPDDVKIIFEKTCADSLLAIRQARHDEDADIIFQQMHSLSGAFGVFEMQSMIDLVNEAAHAVKTSGVREAEMQLEVLCQALAKVAKGESVETHHGMPEAYLLLEQIVTLANSTAVPEVRAQIAVLEQRMRLLLAVNSRTD